MGVGGGRVGVGGEGNAGILGTNTETGGRTHRMEQLASSDKTPPASLLCPKPADCSVKQKAPPPNFISPFTGTPRPHNAWLPKCNMASSHLPNHTLRTPLPPAPRQTPTPPLFWTGPDAEPPVPPHSGYFKAGDETQWGLSTLMRSHFILKLHSILLPFI